MAFINNHDCYRTALTQNVWTKISSHNQRQYLDLKNLDVTSDIRVMFKHNPWAVTADGTDDCANIDAMLADTDFMASTSGELRAHIYVDSTLAAASTIIGLGDTNANAYIKFGLTSALKLTASARIAAAVQWTMTSSAAVPTDKWITVKLIHNGTTPTMYLDGLEVDATFSVDTDKTYWVSTTTGIDNARIGCDSVNSAGDANFFKGYIQAVTLYRGVGINRVTTAYYPADEGTGTTLGDDSGNAYDGSLSGSPAWAAYEYGMTIVSSSGFTFGRGDAPQGPIWALTTATGMYLYVCEGY